MADDTPDIAPGPEQDPSFVDAGVAEPVLVGAASAALGGGATSVMSAPVDAPGGGASLPRAAHADDTPIWSFPDSSRTRSRPGSAASTTDENQVELPFPPAPQPTPQARPQPMFGPVAQARSTVLVPVLAVLSLGVYALVWHQRVNRELEEFDPKLHARPSQSAFGVTVPWLLGLLATVAGAVLLVGARLSIHVPFAAHVSTWEAYMLLAGLALVPYLTLLLPFSTVAVVMTLERLRCVEEHVGVTTDRQIRPVAQSQLLVIPVVGGLVLLSLVQRRVNAIWDAVTHEGRQAT
jgi:hypothetical protein